jgi:chromatin remodeling complex protein RSC6
VEDMPAIRPEDEDAEEANEDDNQLDTDSVEFPSERAQVNEDAVQITLKLCRIIMMSTYTNNIICVYIYIYIIIIQ